MIAAVQHLRGVAALLVVIHHAAENVPKYYQGQSWIDRFLQPLTLGNAAVDLFFVISGFIMMISTAGEEKSVAAARTFAKRRLIRIVPLYWFYTTIVVATVLLAPSLLPAHRFEWSHTLCSYLFIPCENSAGHVRPPLHMGWTLNYEMYFYLLMALFLPLGRRVTVLLIVAIFSISSACHRLVSPANDVLRFYTDPILIDFLLGMGLGCFHGWKRLGPASARLCFGVGLAAFALFAYAGFFGLPRFLTAGLSATLLIAGCINLPSPRSGPVSRILAGIGDSSYSLYLVHFFTLPVWGKAVAGFGLAGLPADALLIGSVVFSVFAGYLSFWLLEAPLARFLRATRAARHAPSAPKQALAEPTSLST